MGSIHPYYRRTKPEPQVETDFLQTLSVGFVIHCLADALSNSLANPDPKTGPDPFAVATLPLLRPGVILGAGPRIRVKALMQAFTGSTTGSLRDLIYRMLGEAGIAPYVNLLKVHMDPYDVVDPIAEANGLFDSRAAAAVYASVCPQRTIRLYPEIQWVDGIPYAVSADTGRRSQKPIDTLYSTLDLLGMAFYSGVAPTIFIPLVKCLSAMAYSDYFPQARPNSLSGMVSDAILAATPGWCGTFGPMIGNTETTILVEAIDSNTHDTMVKAKLDAGSQGNYDMSQMYLLPMAYRYYDEISPDAREHLITELLAHGRIRRANKDDTLTCGRVPNDWSRAGYLSAWPAHKDIGETENHILTIHTARYLTNQLFYQRYYYADCDNRRNSSDDAPSCTELMLGLLRNILSDDFSEYNAKPYQDETRTALLNLCTYAYDHEVRLAARMVLDYVSAHIAVSSNDLRRMVPFRRRNEEPNS
jgi:hypothetical protein